MLKRQKISERERKKIISSLKHALEEEDVILFVYLYGSFHQDYPFVDIVVAIYIDERLAKGDLFKHYLSLWSRVDERIRGYEVDMRLLNDAPLSFQFEVLKKGDIICCKDDPVRIGFETDVMRRYFDFFPYRKRFYDMVVKGVSYE